MNESEIEFLFSKEQLYGLIDNLYVRYKIEAPMAQFKAIVNLAREGLPPKVNHER